MMYLLSDVTVNNPGCRVNKPCYAGSQSYIGMCVFMATGLQTAGIGLSHYTQQPKQVNPLTVMQVTTLLVDYLCSTTNQTHDAVTNVMEHPAFALQLKLLSGLPGFVEAAAWYLSSSLRNSMPATDGEHR